MPDEEERITPQQIANGVEKLLSGMGRRRKKPDSTWQQQLVIQALNLALEDDLTLQAALHQALIAALWGKPSLIRAIGHAFQIPEDDPSWTDFSDSNAAIVVTEAAEVCRIMMDEDVPRYGESQYLIAMARLMKKREQGETND